MNKKAVNDKKIQGFDLEKLYVLPPYVLDELRTLPLTKDVYITDIGCFPTARHHYRERPKGCEAHILIYCSKGSGFIQTGNKDRVMLTEQSFAYIPAGVPHVYSADEDDPWTIYWLHIQGAQAAEFIRLFAAVDTPIQLMAADEQKLLELFHQCYDLLLSKSYSEIHLVHVSQSVQYMLSLLLTAAARKYDTNKLQGHVEIAIRYMNEHLESQAVTLEQIARYTKVSKQHLNYIFKQSTGYSPVDYYLRMKMQRAGQLLDLTDRSIKEISALLGFKDPYYFSRLFKKLMGSPPSGYRQKLKG
ncbi:AraC family transcriptional regulator [Neobacillus mesonae]|nr:AraC family transcriptional regulator [Neobacillus mesonae]